MLKREFKVNLKSFVIWELILILMFLVVYLIYPFMMTDETVKMLDETLKGMSPELLKAFNMDMTSIATAYGWLKSEGFVYVLMIVGLYASVIGGSILLKEENDMTIEYLNSLPVKRNNILTNKVIVAITYIILLVLLLGIFNFIALLISGDFEHKQFILLSITPIFIGLPLFGLSLFISTFFHKTKGVIPISLGLVFIFYLLSVLSELSDKVEFLKYFSIYTLADTRNVLTDLSINPIMVIISFIITFVFIVLSYIRYNRKELV